MRRTRQAAGNHNVTQKQRPGAGSGPLDKNFVDWHRQQDGAEPKFERLFVLFRLLFRGRKPLEALQEFFLGHALDRDLGVVSIDARAG